jgi:hypothetical protein
MVGADMNTLELNNVELSDEVQKTIKANSPRELKGVDKLLDPVVQRLAVLNPLWRFVVHNVGYGYEGNLAATDFKVMEAGEELGTISREHHGHNYVIQISNPRIGKERTRSGGYKTKDADKAILKAKKMFFKLKPSERVEKAMKDAGGVIQQQSRRKEREKYTVENTVRDAAINYIMGTGFPLFLEHTKTMAEKERSKIEIAMREKARLHYEMMTIENARTKFEAGKTALVIKDDGKYLVKIGDKIDLFDDNTLPDWMRGKLGMLKLVQAEQFVTDVGCRVNDDTFVLIVEED